MNKMSIIILVAFLAILVLFFWLGLGQDPRYIPSALLDKSAPTFTANSLLDKNTITNKIFNDKVTLLNVWTSDCYPCLTEHHVLMEITDDNQSQDFQIIGINYKDEPEKAKQLLKKLGNPFKAIIDDQDGAIGMNFGVYGTPETYIIDKNAVIRYRHTGSITPNLWQTELLPIINKLK